MTTNIFTDNVHLKAFLISLFVNILLILFISTLISLPAHETEESYMELSLLDTIPPVLTKEEQDAKKENKENSFWNKIINNSPSATTTNTVSESSKNTESTGTNATNTIDSSNTTTSNSVNGQSGNGNSNTQNQPTNNAGNTLSGNGNSNVTAKPAEITAPYAVSKVTPEYTDEARENGWQGEVLLRVSISSSGTPDKVTLVSSSGYKALDRAAIAAVKQWRFSPAKNSQTGETLPSQVTIPINFNLN